MQLLGCWMELKMSFLLICRLQRDGYFAAMAARASKLITSIDHQLNSYLQSTKHLVIDMIFILKLLIEFISDSISIKHMPPKGILFRLG
jgi:hypothetical protein